MASMALRVYVKHLDTYTEQKKSHSERANRATAFGHVTVYITHRDCVAARSKPHSDDSGSGLHRVVVTI